MLLFSSYSPFFLTWSRSFTIHGFFGFPGKMGMVVLEIRHYQILEAKSFE